LFFLTLQVISIELTHLIKHESSTASTSRKSPTLNNHLKMHWVRVATKPALTVLVTLAAFADAQLCPGSNGQTYTDSCGAKYVIECDTDHAGGDLSGITAPYVESLEACIAICSANSACKDVSWILGSPKGACYQKGSVGSTESNVGIWTGRQISGCQAIQVAVTTPAPVAVAPAVIQATAPAAQQTTVIVNNQPAVIMVSRPMEVDVLVK
jgi:hypothetical protein